MGKEKSKKRRRSSSSSESSSNSSSSESSHEKKKLRKLKKKLKREQKKTEKLLKKKLKESKRKLKKKRRSNSDSKDSRTQEATADIPIELMEKSKAMAPMTKEEWEQRQSVVRRVMDEETGRYRLIKGDGEVIEEIVSRDRHRQINRQATNADGTFFQSQTLDKKML
ncbi:PREDICTED: ADP-ribosylation factor-like protein 6-interacting protein 4 [Papilio xuthus]|uniref:ADP-ribosylation factor-like protein 6-interacting protein 4 n=1 Tax=Papilio xuthus TaxID=66420 RepID=A0A194QFS2_PAPXU|nr:PREDICTED: ADP-ribosylation factor-like protein 6-interacting protein 4 [Papilio xuthus]KPJ04337.1 ADP-ribosylation factor-like protein 6-interacting protein 4 [Papilio xuthus]